MSFSSDVKKELVEIQVENNCCKKSLLYGMALFSKSFSFREVVFQSKSRATAELYCSLLKELCSIKAECVSERRIFGLRCGVLTRKRLSS